APPPSTGSPPIPIYPTMRRRTSAACTTTSTETRRAGQHDLSGSPLETHDMANSRKKLSDILSNGSGDNFRNNWNATAAADDFGPLPPGEYTVRILSGELFKSKRKETPGYKLTLEVTAGDYEGHRLWCDLWLTTAALPMTKRDLAKIGITQLEQLEEPIPPGILPSSSRWRSTVTTTATKSTRCVTLSTSASSRATPSRRRTARATAARRSTRRTSTASRRTPARRPAARCCRRRRTT